jgi:hypothetical protein
MRSMMLCPATREPDREQGGRATAPRLVTYKYVGFRTQTLVSAGHGESGEPRAPALIRLCRAGARTRSHLWIGDIGVRTETRAPPKGAVLDRDGAAQAGDDLVHDSKAKVGAAGISGAGLVEPDETRTRALGTLSGCPNRRRRR